MDSAWENRLRAVIGLQAPATDISPQSSKREKDAIDIQTIFPTGLVGEYYLLQLSFSEVVPGSVRIVLKSNGKNAYTMNLKNAYTMNLLDGSMLYSTSYTAFTINYITGQFSVATMYPDLAVAPFDVEVAYRHFVYDN